jgi:hypothetical protein
LPPAPFINVDDSPMSRERWSDLAELGVVWVVSLLLTCGALAVALILQATWWPVAGGIAAVLILLLVLAMGGIL